MCLLVVVTKFFLHVTFCLKAARRLSSLASDILFVHLKWSGNRIHCVLRWRPTVGILGLLWKFLSVTKKPPKMTNLLSYGLFVYFWFWLNASHAW